MIKGLSRFGYEAVGRTPSIELGLETALESAGFSYDRRNETRFEVNKGAFRTILLVEDNRIEFGFRLLEFKFKYDGKADVKRLVDLLTLLSQEQIKAGGLTFKSCELGRWKGELDGTVLTLAMSANDDLRYPTVCSMRISTTNTCKEFKLVDGTVDELFRAVENQARYLVSDTLGKVKKKIARDLVKIDRFEAYLKGFAQ